MIARLLGVLPALIAALALGRAAHDGTLAGVLAAAAAILAVAGPRWELDRGRQWVTSAMGAGAGYAVVAVLYDPQPGSLGEGWTRFSAAAILAAAARFLIVEPKGGTIATTALLFAALLSAGETHVSGYVAFVVAFLLTSLWAGARGGRPLGTETTARRFVSGTAIALVGAAIAAGVIVGLRAAYAWVSGRERSTAFVWQPRVGFSDRMDLGALDGLLDSDTVVLRVRGPHVDYLRGAVLDIYSAGRWLRSDSAEVETETRHDGDPSSGGGIQVSAASERTDRFFLPLAARLLATAPGALLVDGVGAVKREEKHGTNVARFVEGERGAPQPALPRISDLQIPRGIRPRLESLAEEWTSGESTAAAKLDAIERRLRTGFHYARTFQRAGGADPVLDFLFGSKSGHCEYFATAMALVARAARIPTRVVMGYRVGERSPMGYYVVRERNAHAWVEAWLPDRGWTTRDATPETELPQNQEHVAGYAESLADALRVAYDDLNDWFRRLTLRQTATAWVVGFAGLLWIVARGARRRVSTKTRAPEDDAGRPCLAVLLSALERSGHAWPTYETIERFAARIPDGEAARLLERYAALRYGSIGDESTLDRDVLAYARAAPGEGSRPVA